MESDIESYKEWSVPNQLRLLEQLLRDSKPEVKYRFQQRVIEFTRYDIIKDLPLEVAEHILLYCDLQTLLNCRCVSRQWIHKVNNATRVWSPFLSKHCINIQDFCATSSGGAGTAGFLTRNKSYSSLLQYNNNSKQMGYDNENYNSDADVIENEVSNNKNLQVIGENIFANNIIGLNANVAAVATTAANDTAGNNPNTITTNNGSIGSRQINYCNAAHFIMGRKIISSLANQGSFQHIVDHDFRGSNIVMAMNEEILAYACEDRHIVVKYADFPNKKISVFEAHACADLKIYGGFIITGGYDCTICVWDWRTGERMHCFEGSIKPVCSLDVVNGVIVSSDGRCVITWSLPSNRMLKKSECFIDERVLEVLLIDPEKCDCLKSVYKRPLLVTRTNRKIKVWLCYIEDGSISFLSNLNFNNNTNTVNYLQPYLNSYNGTLACSSEHGLMVWSLTNEFKLLRTIEYEPCKSCQASRMTGLSAEINCRFILLYFSESFILHYAVHKNVFQLVGCKSPHSPVVINWKYPSSGKWPWSHRKPGMAALVLNLDKGVCMGTRIVMFVGTHEKRIHCMFFDASDLDYGFETTFGGYLDYS